MPKGLLYILIVLFIALLIPPAVIALSRTTVKKKPRIHYVQDMDNQHRYKAQQVNSLFADGRAMRPSVEGTVARGTAELDEHLSRGLVGDNWATSFPAALTVDEAFIRHGQERFNIYCMPCHGEAGFGDGMVHQRAMKLVAAGVNGTTWVPPLSIHDPTVVSQPVGQLFNTITNGVRTMPAYGEQIPVADRWAIVAYMKALQRSQNASESDLPSGTSRSSLPVESLPQEQIENSADNTNQNNSGAGES